MGSLMADSITHKRGDTFRVHGRFTGADYTGWTGRSQVRQDDNDEKLSDLTFRWVDAADGVFVTEILETSNWPANKYVLYDVEIRSIDGEVRSSDAIRILVARDVSYGTNSG